ncbi:ester cyclase [Kitasatospora sp. NPDC058965]|uniref:nuclear transport factor 2 family protein n=1 Tax=Kitasatospora sp. NPDC058965 TaxID=3346682 RepID=UPI00367A5227
MTNVQQNTRLVLDYLDTVWNQGRTEEAGRFVAAELAQHNHGLADGRSALVELIGGLRSQFPELRFEVARTAAEGDLVFVHSLAVLTPGQPGTAVVDVFRIADGLIAEHWDVAAEVPETTASGRPVV